MLILLATFKAVLLTAFNDLCKFAYLNDLFSGKKYMDPLFTLSPWLSSISNIGATHSGHRS